MIKWELKWAKTRRFLKEKAREAKAERSIIQDKLAVLERTCRELAKTRKTTADGELTRLEKEIRTLEDSQAKVWRRWSQMRWMKEGDAPSKFFFTLLRIKRQKEGIFSLDAEDGRRLESQEEILQELHRYYTNLYRQEEVSTVSEAKRREVLGGITKKVTGAQNTWLSTRPDSEEIQKTVAFLKNEKAPGADGMTAEMVKVIWEHSQQDVIEFIHTFWETEILSWKQLTGVIKLIPKEGDRLKIKNWRPLQMLNLGYKIISKILANRLREVAGDFIDMEQKGFLKGRSISDNVLNFLLLQEWAEVEEQPAIFVKVDFEKAYDRVCHRYLWETMESMGFNAKFIQLVQGLVQGSDAKIHINGQFSEEIQIERGVKQGCPLAPLLFALSTQPLMTILRARQAEGRLVGLKLGEGKQALHNLFADDTGVMIAATPENFEELQRAIIFYEEISGAKLNISKSTVIPIAMTRTPGWLNNIGCYVAREGEVVRYLGHPIGWNVKAAQKCDYILGKIQRRLGSWTYRMLSFAGRMVVLKYVLKVMPNHLFTCLALNQKSLGFLESACRKFLWGQNDSGADRIPLIAWGTVTRAKQDGGLAVTSFEVQGKAIRLHHFLRVFTSEEEDRIHAFQATLQTTMAKRAGSSLKHAKVGTVGRWSDWAYTHNSIRPLQRNEAAAEELGKEIAVQSGNVEDLPWYWQIGAKRISSWKLQTRTCKGLFVNNTSNTEKINGRWRTSDNSRRWAKRFSKVWKSLLPAKHKILIWKLLHHGIPTLEKARTWGHGDGRCLRCGNADENVEHLFWTCEKSQEKWREFSYLAEGLKCRPPRGLNLLSSIDYTFYKNEPARYFVWMAIVNAIWQERNHRSYTGRVTRIPLSISIEHAIDMAKAQLKGVSQESRKHGPLLEAIEVALNLKQRIQNLRQSWEQESREASPTRSNEPEPSME
ncbi:hypothetical protein R1sor_011425 [Riccia sorocarpa]|uniref:Reverse transcriptase domain-containing protein n=1 Tax=Riccia sorocarpa TaxID=122646 RepID=A0ABD3I4B1_9MARC